MGMEYRIDCAKIITPQEFHRTLAETLSFPEWYGHNLDALYDCLTELEATHLVLENWDECSPFAQRFRDTFLDAQEENPDLSIVFQ